MTSIKRPVHFVVETLSQAGGVRVILELANRLVERDWKVAIWSVNPKELGSWFHLDSRVKYYSFFKTGTTADYQELAAGLVRQDGIKIGTFWRTCYPLMDSLNGNGDTGAYLVQDVETSYVSQPAYANLVTQTYQMPLLKLTTSKWVQSQIPDCTWISLGLDNRYRPNPKIKREQFILACARIQALKGWDFLCESARYISATGGRVVTFGHNDKLPMLTKTQHIHDPNDDQIRRLYQRAGVFINTSVHEGFSMMPLEAMACGTPVSCTDADGNREYIEDGENCLVSNDPFRLVENCARIMNDPALSRKLSDNGIKTAERYKWGPVVNRLESALLS